MTYTRQHIFAYLYFLLLMLALLGAMLPNFATHFIGDAFSDATEYAHHIWWINHAIRNGEPIFFQPLLAYPDGLPGAWLWGNPLQSSPAWLFLFVMPLPAAYNLGALLHLSLNGWAAYFLGWRLTRSLPAAILGGTVFALYPALQGHLIASHIGLLVLWGVPFYALALLRLRDHTRPQDLALAALALVISVLGNNLLLIYVLFPLSLVLVLVALSGRDWPWFGRMLAAGVLGGAGASVFILPVLLEQIASPRRAIGGVLLFNADLFAVLAPSFYNPLFSDLTYARDVLGGIKNIEGTAYVGLIAGGLSLVALWQVPKARWWGGLALLAWVFSLGPLLKVRDELVTVTVGGVASYVPLPWMVLGQLPILETTRTTGRFNLVIGLAVAVLAAFGWQWIMQRIRRPALGWAITGLLLLVIAFEYQVMWRGNWPYIHSWPYPQVAAVEALRDDPNVEAVFNLPYNHYVSGKDAMILQTIHQKPIIAGHITRGTPVDTAKLAILQQTLDPALLRLSGADVVLLLRRWDLENSPGPVEENALARLGDPYYTDDDLMLWRVPPTTDDPTFQALPYVGSPQVDRALSYAYAPANSWATFTGETEVPAVLSLNDTPLHTVDGRFRVRVPLTTGYHTLRLLAPSECLRTPDPTLHCITLRVRDVAFSDWSASGVRDAIAFERGITLTDYELTPDRISLAWRFDDPPPDDLVRFIHLLDTDGRPVLQVDHPTPAIVDSIDLTDLPPGTYTAYVGWYTLPDVSRLVVLSDEVAGASDGWAQLGSVEVE
jgi:hypothetical protein